MADMKKTLIMLSVGVTAVVATAVSAVVGIAILTGFKNTGQVDNTTTDLFIAGIALVGTFISLIVLGFIGKILLGLFKESNY